MADALAPLPPPDGLPALGLLVDWGGVLTAPLADVIGGWLAADAVAPEHFRDVLHGWLALGQDRPPGDGHAEADRPPDTSPVHALERGELPERDFERLLAGELAARGSPVAADGLLDRILGGLAELDEPMLGVVAGIRAAGVPTALVSNSWGERYPERLFDGRFDAVVISGRVGMRKPERGILDHAAAALGIPLGCCVLVDDLPPNVEGARLAGAGAVHHVGVEATAQALHALFGLAPEAGALPGGAPAPDRPTPGLPVTGPSATGE